MVQELGETVQEMQKADEKEIEKILNRRPSGHYWIVIGYKPTHKSLKTGEHMIMRVVKDYDKKPTNLLGTIILEVRDGDIINETINIHDIPINWGLIEPKAGLIEHPYVQRRSDISDSYIYNE